MHTDSSGKASSEIQFTAEYCSQIHIAILEVDKKKMACKEGICAGITKIEIESDIHKTEYSKCSEKEESETALRFFNEPSHPDSVIAPRRSL